MLPTGLQYGRFYREGAGPEIVSFGSEVIFQMAKDGRNDKGQFVDGNPGGPGRPPRVIENEYLKVFTENVSLDDWGEIIAKTVELAKDGDNAARSWLSDRLIGKGGLIAIGELESLVKDAEFHRAMKEPITEQFWDSVIDE